MKKWTDVTIGASNAYWQKTSVSNFLNFRILRTLPHTPPKAIWKQLGWQISFRVYYWMFQQEQVLLVVLSLGAWLAKQ